MTMVGVYKLNRQKKQTRTQSRVLSFARPVNDTSDDNTPHRFFDQADAVPSSVCDGHGGGAKAVNRFFDL